MDRLRIACLALIMALPVMAADYQIKTVKILPIESYPAKTTIAAITIAADPYPNDEKSFTAFDVKDLNSKGYFPLHLIIRNSSSGFIAVRTRDITILTADGQKLYTTSATLVVQDVIKGGLVSKLPKMKSHDPSTSTRAGSPLLDFTGKELTNRQIEPGSVSDGFVFFYTDEPKKPFFKGGKITIPQVMDEITRRSLGPFEIDLEAALSPNPGSR
jgi:hypothetical protein